MSVQASKKQRQLLRLHHQRPSSIARGSRICRRRNLTPMQLSYYRGIHYKTDKKMYGSNNPYLLKSIKGHNDPLSNSTSERLAKQYKVSRNTIRRDTKTSDAINAIGEYLRDEDRAMLQQALRSCIDRLEDLCWQGSTKSHEGRQRDG